MVTHRYEGNVQDFAEAGSLAEALAAADERRKHGRDDDEDDDADSSSFVRGIDVRAECLWRKRLFGKLTR